MDAPTIVGIETATSAGAACVVAVPEGVQDGDLLLGFFSDVALSPNTITGFTTIQLQEPQAYGAYVAFRVADSEPASYSFTSGATNTANTGVIMVLRGADIENPVNAWTWTRQTTTGVDVKTAPSVITTVDNCLIIRWLASIEQRDCTFPGGTTERWDINQAGGNGAMQAGGTSVQETAGATGTCTITVPLFWWQYLSDTHGSGTLAIAPGVTAAVRIYGPAVQMM